MNFSLYQKLSFVIFTLFVVIAALFFWFTIKVDIDSRHQAEQKLHAKLAEHLVNDNPLLSEGVNDYKALENLFHTQMVLGPSFEFYYVDVFGKIITYSAKPEKIKREKVDLSPILSLINSTQPLPIYGEDPRNIEKLKIFSAAPIFSKDGLQGYLYVIIGGEVYDSIFDNVQLNKQLLESGLLMAIALLLLFVLLMMIFRSFTQPLRRLCENVEAVKKAGFDLSVIDINAFNTSENNEVNALAIVFRELIEQVNGQFEQLKQTDQYRRELLAQLSHDLRTPLSSIQGYIETLDIKQNELTQYEKQHYIKTALKSSHQLRRLIDQIFELAHLESGQVNVEKESFCIEELLYDIVAKFALKAQAKQIEIAFSPKHPFHIVNTDMGKLERVLTNLIENALRHTMNKGVIALKVQEVADQKRLNVFVIDNGTGIAPSELRMIFEPRYRASNSQGVANEHAGLGLAITQKLLALLQSNISVSSELGKGTEFSFDLTLTS